MREAIPARFTSECTMWSDPDAQRPPERVFDAIEVRLYRLPMAPLRVVAAMKSRRPAHAG